LKFSQSNVLQDGSGILAAGLTNGTVSLLKMNNKEITPHATLNPKLKDDQLGDVVYCVNYNQRRMGSHLISAGNGNYISLWDMETAKLIDEFDSKQKGGIWNLDMLDVRQIFS
jgi:WD40 repeat protein